MLSWFSKRLRSEMEGIATECTMNGQKRKLL